MKALKKLKSEEMMFLDIETVRVNEELGLDFPEFDAWDYKMNKDGLMSNRDLQELYIERAALYPEFGKIVAISVGMIVNDELKMKSYYGDDEEKILRDFVFDLERTQASRKLKLAGWAIIGFDIPYIFKRCLVNRITPPTILDSSGDKPWDMADRGTTDLKDLWKATGFESTSLICATVAMGLPHSKDDISGKDVGTVYYSEGIEGLQRIRTYCEKDVWSTANLFRACRFETLLPFPEQPLTIENVPLLTALFNGASFGAKIKKKLEDMISDLSDEDREKAIDIVETLSELKTTKVTKTYVKSLKEKYAVTTEG